eukprot:755113-Hanusia_phi.AAC.3
MFKTLLRCWRDCCTWEKVKEQVSEIFLDDAVTSSHESRCQLLRQSWPNSRECDELSSSSFQVFSSLLSILQKRALRVKDCLPCLIAGNGVCEGGFSPVGPFLPEYTVLFLDSSLLSIQVEGFWKGEYLKPQCLVVFRLPRSVLTTTG